MDFVITIAAKIGEYLVAPIGRQLGYLLCYNCNIKDFRKQVENLEPERATIQIRVEAAERNGDVILPNVQMWLTSANKIAEESRNLLNDDNGCFNGHCLCLDLKLRYQRSRKAKKKTTEVVELKRDGKFDIVSCPAPPLAIGSTSTCPAPPLAIGSTSNCLAPPLAIGSTSTEDAKIFESRKSISKEIMEALKDNQISMIGIYGMGGVGKTTLVNEVGKQAKDANLFDEVVMAVVSQTPNVRRIQGEIADMLGLREFYAETDSGRSKRLFARLMNEKRKLVILDDIWDTVELEAIGIPFGAEHKSCKIVLTSRRQDVCEQMNTQKNFPIEVLSEREAWNLFRKMAGDSVDSPDLHPLAVEVAKECAGLPIAIVTVARALKNKSSFHWRDTVNRLRKSNIPSKRVFESLELSYNYLESEEAKPFFLLCSLFPEDHNIAIQDLLKYGMGLGLFQDVDTVDEARERAHRLADDLKSSCLLQDSSKEECVKMHDVVRDVAISIASKDKHGFLVRAGPQWKEWPKMDIKCYTAISLMSNDIHELPDGLECPKLQTLLLEFSRPSFQFPDNFFLSMENLKVLKMSGMHFLSLPPSLRYLKSLQTLCLDDCSLEDISVIGELKKLEILSFLGSNIKELTKEIGMLTHLRLLDLTRCVKLTIIPPDVIQGLSQLEELYMPSRFDNWEIEREDKERSNASLAELKHLSRLTTLELYISDANCLPKDSLFENLSRFKISIDTRFEDLEEWDLEMEKLPNDSLFENYYSCSKILKLMLNKSTPLKDGVNVLLKKAEHLHLEEMKGLKSVLNGLDSGGFLNLKNLDVRKCNEVEYIFNAMEWDSHAVFPILKKLDLSNLPNLREICHGQLPTGCFCELQELRLLRLPGLINMWKDPAQHVCFRNLRVVKVEDCGELKNLFSHSIAKDLSKLLELEVGRCKIMEEIFGNEKEAAAAAMDDIVFPHLRSLRLYGLPNLRNFYSKMKCLALKGDLDTHTEGTLFDKKIAFPALETLKIKDVGNFKVMWHPQVLAKSFSQLRVLKVHCCDEVITFVPHGTLGFQNLSSIDIYKCSSLKSLFSSSIASSLVQLQEVDIRSCEMMEMIIANERKGEENCIEIIVFPKLHTLKLRNLPKLMSFYREAPQEGNLDDPIQPLFDQKVAFPALENLLIDDVSNFKVMWHSQVSAKSFSQLRVLKVHCCDEVITFVPHGTLGFQNLSSIDIYKCSSLKSLFSSSIASSLVQLQEVDIRSCEMMETIIAKEREGEENCIEIFVFPKLHTLKLQNLPKLVSFYREAPQEGNLDDPIQPLFDQKVAFPALENLLIDDVSNFKVMWHPQVPAQSFSQLRVLKVHCCDEVITFVPHGTLGFQNLSSIDIYKCSSLKSLFSSSIASSLVQLQEVDIRSCEMMETIIAKEREGEENCIEIFVFPKLHTLKLQNLPKLMSFYREAPQEGNLDDPIQPLFDQKVALTNLEELWILDLKNLQEIFHNQLPDKFFCQLKTLWVKRCNKLSRVVPSSLLPRLKNLKEFYVSECNSVEEIFEGPIGEGQAIISLSQLQKLDLWDLPSLRIFCSGNYTLECPSLTFVRLKDCPKMHTFSSGFISTPKLNDVNLEVYKNLWKGDLNSTVQYLFHEKGNLESDTSSGQEVEEEEEEENIHKKSEEADEVEEEVESEENVSAQAIQHEISELAEEEA